MRYKKLKKEENGKIVLLDLLLLEKFLVLLVGFK
jgi:hypothetical protein